MSESILNKLISVNFGGGCYILMQVWTRKIALFLQIILINFCAISLRLFFSNSLLRNFRYFLKINLNFETLLNYFPKININFETLVIFP